MCVLEEFRNYPEASKNLLKLTFAFRSLYLTNILKSIDMEPLYDLLDEILDPKHPFIDDLFDVIGNQKEFIDYILIFVKRDGEGKNFTTIELLEIIKNITNIEGMDKVVSHIINSPHNIGLIKVIEIKFINGTKYANIYDYLKNDTVYPHKNQLIKLVYNILKSGLLIPKNKLKDETIILDIINFLHDFINSIKPKIINDLKDILNLTNTTFLYNFTMEVLNSTFFDDFFNALKNNTDLRHATSVLIAKSINGDITKEIVFNFTSKLLNDNRMEKILGRLVNSTHNLALLQIGELFILNYIII